MKEFRAEIATKCENVLKSWPKARDETTNSRLGLALFKAYKLSLMIRNASGQYSSVNDDDECRFGSKESRSSVLKFKPQFIIVPGRMVRIQALGKDKLAIGEHHQATAVDLIHAGGDGGELDAAEAEKEEEAVDDNNTVFITHHILCEPSILMDDKGHILDEHRTMIRCPFCEQEALMGSPLLSDQLV